MKILAIETSTMLGGVATADENGLIAELRLNVKTTHSERLMTAIDYLLNQPETALSDIDVFAVAAGPGSFTGLRIGLSTAKGLCFATGKPLVMVPTLKAFAWSFPYCCYPVCLMLDARRGEVYTAIYEWRHDRLETLLGETSIKVEDACRETKGRVLFAGEGANIYRENIIAAMGEAAVFAPPDKMVPSPASVAAYGTVMALRGEFADPAMAKPLYVRKSEAEVKWLKGQ